MRVFQRKKNTFFSLTRVHGVCCVWLGACGKAEVWWKISSIDSIITWVAARGCWLWARRHHYGGSEKFPMFFYDLISVRIFFLLIRVMEKSDPFSLWLITRELFVGLWNLRFRSSLDEWRRNMNWKIFSLSWRKIWVSSVFLSFRTSLQSSSTSLVKSQFALELDGKRNFISKIFSRYSYIFTFGKIENHKDREWWRGWRKWGNFSQFIKSWKVCSFLRWIVGIFHVYRFWQSKHSGRHFK